VQVEGSVALITGGASGLGHGAASRFVEQGGNVALLDIDEQKGASAIGPLGTQAKFFACDVRDPDAVASAVAAAANEWGKIDILVNAAGVAPA
jgi:3-hydroxyacyl-CoA dehydrogenase/3-hydroxy-2-methylbutyryl-CoA dehydrogenase